MVEGNIFTIRILNAMNLLTGFSIRIYLESFFPKFEGILKFLCEHTNLTRITTQIFL